MVGIVTDMGAAAPALPRRAGRERHGISVAASACRLALAALGSLAAASCPAADVFSSQLSFSTQDQSLWGGGDAFIFDYKRFVGVQDNPAAWVFNPSTISGSQKLPFPLPTFDYSVDPYVQFKASFKLGMDVGASVNSGSLNARLDYAVAMQAPDHIVKGQPFGLTSQAVPLGTSSFTTVAPTASAYVDGILNMNLGGYVRFVTAQDLGSHDYRMGNHGYSDHDSANLPYRSLADVTLSPEIVSLNRGGNGQLMVVGQTIGGVGSSYQAGSTTITAGDWRVAPTGSLQGHSLQGGGATTMLTATLDVDQLATGGVPVFGTGIQHDWGVISMDMGYDVVDLKTSLSMGLKQSLVVDAAPQVRLSFSQPVLIDGVIGSEFTGALDALPQLTLLGDSVTVTPQFLVAATLRNTTDLSFATGAELTVLAAHMKAAYDINFLGLVDQAGTVIDKSIGPYYSWSTTVPLGDIGVYDQSSPLLGFQTIAGNAFVLNAVPEPATTLMWLAGIGVVALSTRRRAARPRR